MIFKSQVKKESSPSILCSKNCRKTIRVTLGSLVMKAATAEALRWNKNKANRKTKKQA
jgi:hypothetical protein